MCRKLLSILFAALAAVWFTASAVGGEARFLVTGVMNPSLIGHAAVRLADGRVLVVGGYASTGGLSAGAQIYDPRTGSWSTTSPMNVARYYHSAVLLVDGRVLVAGGIADGTYLTSAEVFDPADETWTATGSLIWSIALTEGVLLSDGRVLVPGSGGRVQLYSPESGTWRAPTAASTAGGVPVLLPSGRVLMPVGTQTQEFDPTTETWSNPATKSVLGVQKAVRLVNGNVLVLCAPDSTAAMIYDPVAVTWTQTGSTKSARAYATATLMSDGKVLVAGGGDVSGTRQTAEIYDPSVGSWSSAGSMYTARLKHTATALTDGSVLLAGGASVTTDAAELCVSVSAGAIDASFDPQVADGSPNPRVSATALQPDGKIVLVGRFGTVGGVPRNRVARINADGLLDASFDPNASGPVDCVAVLPDGKIVIGGDFQFVGGIGRNGLARLNQDGSVDPSFAPSVAARISCLAVQPDGKIVVGRSSFGARVTRLNLDGSTDVTYQFTNGGSVDALAIQADGKIIVGGAFLSAGDLPRNYLARLNADGTLDVDYAPASPDTIISLALQADGRLLAIAYGGKMKRFLADGTPDATFTGPVTRSGAHIYCAAVQADGKIVIGGEFSSLDGVEKGQIARLMPDGRADHSFVATFSGSVFSAVLQSDGQVVVAGDFTSHFSPALSRFGMARLGNDPIVHALEVPMSSQVRWERSGAAPELDFVSFEQSLDNGTLWTLLGYGTRTAEGWELSGQELDGKRGLIRARGRTSGSYRSSSGLIEETTAFDFDMFTVAPVLTAPSGLHNSPLAVNFTLPEPAKSGTLKLTFSGATTHELLLASSGESSGEHAFTFAPSNPSAAPQIANGGPIGDGVYSVVLSYEDELGHPAAASQALSTTIDTTPPTITPPTGGFQPAPWLSEGTLLPDYASQVSAIDLNGLSGSVSQHPPPGEVLAETVRVSLSVPDLAGNIAVLEFDVDVRAENLTCQSILAKGAMAPGRGTNELPPDAVLTSFGAPAVSAEGDLAFVAKWTSSTEKRGTGLFLNDTCLAVVGGDAAAIGGAGAKWARFADPVVSEGHVVSLATLSGLPRSTAAVVVGNLNGASLEKIARAGEIAPGAGLGGAKFKGFRAVGMSGKRVALLAELALGSGTPKVTPGSDIGLWYYEGSQLSLVMRESDSVDGRTIKTLKAFQPGDGSAGESRGTMVQSSANGDTLLTALALFMDRTQGLITRNVTAGTPSASLTRSQDAAVGLPDGSPFASYGPPARTSAGSVVFRGALTVGAGTTKANASGIFTGPLENGRFASLVRAEDDASDAGDGATFRVVKDPAVSVQGDIAFLATVGGGAVRGAAGKTVWWQPAGGQRTLVAQAGQSLLPVPGLNDAQFAAFQAVAVSATRGPLFTATLIPGKGGVRKGQTSGLWAMDSNGEMRRVIQTGLLVGGKKLRSFQVLNAVPGSTGERRSFNEPGEIAWLATFDDGRRAIVVSAVP